MNQVKTNSIVALLIWVALYLAGSFASVSFNISHWPEDTRELVAIASILSAGVIIMVSFLNESDKRSKY